VGERPELSLTHFDQLGTASMARAASIGGAISAIFVGKIGQLDKDRGSTDELESYR
jgi:hypothetical protein